MKIVVVGAGVAGLAAAFAARRRDASVTLLDGGAGSTALTSGAVDDAPWDELLAATRTLGARALGEAAPLAEAIAEFARELDLWHLAATERSWIATVAGQIRPARGRDRALLDFADLRDVCVTLPRVERAAWDADALAKALAASARAKDRGLGFRAVDAAVLRFDDELRASDLEIASRHDDPARLAWLAERLSALRLEGPLLLGPWLGASASRAEDLAARIGAPVGEALAGTSSPAGMRFEAARDRLLAKIGVERVRGRAARVGRSTTVRIALELASGEDTLHADAVVLATGGIASGGVRYAPPERSARRDLPEASKVPFELSLEAPVSLSEGAESALGATGRLQRLETIASMQGPDLDGCAWPSAGRAGLLESVGVVSRGLQAAAGIWVAGDVVAGRPRTMLQAVASGLDAGARAATAAR